MAYGVLLHRADSIYNDQPERQYQFPKQYLGRASQFVGDWIVYYEPGKSVTARRYFAIARVEKIIPDPSAPDMYLALIEAAGTQAPHFTEGYILWQTGTTVAIGYGLWRPGEANCCPTGGSATVRVVLRNGVLTALDPIPPPRGDDVPLGRG